MIYLMALLFVVGVVAAIFALGKPQGSNANQALDDVTDLLDQATASMKQRLAQIHIHKPKTDFDLALEEAKQDNP